MKKVFYLNLEDKNFVKQKFWSKKYVKLIKRVKTLKYIFNVDNNSEISPIAFQRGSNGISVFLKEQKVFRINFSNNLYIKSFFSFETRNKQISLNWEKFYKLIRCKKFQTMFLLNPVKCGFTVHAGGVNCYFPKNQMSILKKSLLRSYKLWKIQVRIKMFVEIFLPIAIKKDFFKKIPTNLKEDFFHKFVFSKNLTTEKLIKKKSFFLKKFPFFYSKFKIVPAYKKKNFVKKIYFWRKYTNFVVIYKKKKPLMDKDPYFVSDEYTGVLNGQN